MVFILYLNNYNNYKTLMKSWINDKKRICTANEQLIFLFRCRRYDLVPSHIQNLKVNISFYSNSVILVNIRNKNVPERVLELLSLDDNFGLPLQQSHKMDRISIALETVKNLETNHLHISNELIETTRISIANSLERFLCKNKHINYVDRYILGGFSLCKEFLRNNDDIFVTKADKGHVTVVMDKKDYLEKMEYILNDQSTICHDWTLWRLPKIHKTGFPLRIIISSLSSPLYNISKYIHDILLNSNLQLRSHIKDGWSFAVDMKDKLINDDKIMISLDFCMLWEKLWNDIAPNTKFNLSQFLYAVEINRGYRGYRGYRGNTKRSCTDMTVPLLRHATSSLMFL
ncbi:hypothetical protein ACFW04_010509 [Cataglyphis niger]